MATTMGITILSIPDLNLVHVAEALDWVFMLIPQYNLGYGLIQISTNSQLHRMCPLGLEGNLFQCDSTELSNYNKQCCEKCP